MIRIPLTLLVLTCLALPVLGEDDAEKKRLADLEAEVARLRDENQKLREQLDVTETAKEDLTVERTRLEQLAGMTAKGELVESRIAQVRTTFDEAADLTSVVTVPEAIQGPGGLQWTEHRMSVRYAHPGRQPTAELPDTFHFDIFTIDNPDTRYRSLRSVTFIIDGESLELPVANYEILETRTRVTRVRTGNRTTSTFREQLTVDFDRPTLHRLSRATEVQIMLFRTRFTLSRENIATFVAVRERLQGGAS